MFRPDSNRDRTDYSGILMPPDGYRLDRAVGTTSIFKEVNAYVQRKQRHRPKGGKPCRSYRQSTPKRSFMNRLRNHPLGYGGFTVWQESKKKRKSI